MRPDRERGSAPGAPPKASISVSIGRVARPMDTLFGQCVPDAASAVFDAVRLAVAAALGDAAEVVTDPIDDTGDRSSDHVGSAGIGHARVRFGRSRLLRVGQRLAEIGEFVATELPIPTRPAPAPESSVGPSIS
jgi:hypothetical protein